MKYTNNPWNLTERQCEVMVALIKKSTNNLAAKALDVSLRTLEAHLWSIYKRMNVTNRAEAMAAFDAWRSEVKAKSGRFSLDWVKARCTEDGDCLIWKNRTSEDGRPLARSYQGDGKRGTTRDVARAHWEAVNGPVPEGLFVASSCGNPRCLNLEHRELIDRSEVNRRAWRKPDVRARRLVKITERSRGRGKLTLELARDIRSSGETLKEVAARLGISIETASNVRRGEAWREVSPFAGLGARA